jgi:hypothetical protein
VVFAGGHVAEVFEEVHYVCTDVHCVLDLLALVYNINSLKSLSTSTSHLT